VPAEISALLIVPLRMSEPVTTPLRIWLLELMKALEPATAAPAVVSTSATMATTIAGLGSPSPLRNLITVPPSKSSGADYSKS